VIGKNTEKGVMNSTSRTDWARIDAMTDDDIDTSDISPLTDEFFSKAKLRMPSSSVTLYRCRSRRVTPQDWLNRPNPLLQQFLDMRSRNLSCRLAIAKLNFLREWFENNLDYFVEKCQL
jgi:hypothetical protein